MSTLLDAQNITVRRGARTVVNAVTLCVADGDRIALVGANGSGKSTLLRVLAEAEAGAGFTGTVRRHGTIGYLPQAVPAGEHTVRDELLARLGTAAAEAELDRRALALAAGDLNAVEPHAAALDRWLALGGDDAEARAGQALSELGLPPETLDRAVGTLSGGQAARVGLAALVASRHDVVLLDEPTNHLDADGLERLGALLRARSGGIVLVSHDRALLERFADTVVALDRRTGRAATYGGGWAIYEREQDRAAHRAQSSYDEAVASRTALTDAEREVRRRAAVAIRKGVPDGDKHGREWVRMRAQERQGRARKIGTRAERIEIPDKPWAPPSQWLELGARPARGSEAVALEGAVLQRGSWALGPLDLVVGHGERVLLDGPNGSGKSTLLAAVAGRQALARGTRRVAPGVMELGQQRDALDPRQTLAEHVRERAGGDDPAIRAALAGFGIAQEVADRPVTTLSEGERTRAELALLSVQGAACLLLDEPTNHLDVESLEVLELALADWPGTLVVASHDRVFRDALRLDRTVFVAEPETIRQC